MNGFTAWLHLSTSIKPERKFVLVWGGLNSSVEYVSSFRRLWNNSRPIILWLDSCYKDKVWHGYLTTAYARQRCLTSTTMHIYLVITSIHVCNKPWRIWPGAISVICLLLLSADEYSQVSILTCIDWLYIHLFFWRNVVVPLMVLELHFRLFK